MFQENSSIINKLEFVLQKGKDTSILAIKDFSYDFKKGEFISIVGPSGCGKSTLLSLISGLMKPEEGTVELHGKLMGYMLQKVGYVYYHLL